MLTKSFPESISSSVSLKLLEQNDFASEKLKYILNASEQDSG